MAGNYYRPNRRKSRRRSGRKILRTVLLCLVIFFIYRTSLSSLGSLWKAPDPPLPPDPIVADIGPPAPGPVTVQSAPAPAPPDQLSEKFHSVQPGDTLSGVCQAYGVPVERIGEWKQSFSEFGEVSRLNPGDQLAFYFREPEKEPVKVVYSPQNDPAVFTIRRSGADWECSRRDEAEAVRSAVSGTISGNLFDSAAEAGLPAGLILELADLFAYDVDFNTDIQQGDSFRIYIEEQVKGGKAIGAGRILAAEMHVNGVRSQAFYYELPDGHKGYFDANGNSLRKMFLKSPLSFSRISSTFSYKRRHPILKTVRPHLGIDYAAPTGAPVSALGSGKITARGRKGGFGRYVEIRHDQTYRTGYAHLSRFAAGLKVGSRVEQGEVIGYVGSSGLATGPHLDFRFYRNGKPVDFLATDFPRARSIPESYRADFERKCGLYLAGLEGKTPANDENGPTDTRHASTE